MTNALYVGRVRHRRLGPKPGSFEQPLYCVYLDADDVEGTLQRLRLVARARGAPLSYRREDYLGPAELSLGDAARSALAEKVGAREVGSIFALTQLRTFGHIENPVSFYYAFDAERGRLAHVIAEITNTPWRERHRYVLAEDENLGDARTLRFRFEKAFHVSPFQPMELTYEWTFTTPGKRLAVHMTSRRGDDVIFEAALTLTRRPLTDAALARALLGQPWMSATIGARTYLEAAKLFARGAEVHPHPERRPSRRKAPGRGAA